MIATLPGVDGFGNAYSLYNGISLDQTVELKTLVEAFVD